MSAQPLNVLDLRRLLDRSRIETLGTVALLLIVGAVIVSRVASDFVDDALITMRFASRVASGYGWTYNIGEHTANGATSPAFTLAIAALTFPLRAATRASNAIFILSIGAIAGFLVMTFQRRQAPWVALASSVAVVLCPLVLATKGMESLPFLALVCGVLWASTTNRDVALGILATLLVLVRGEGALLVGIVFLQLWMTRRAFPVKATVAAALTAAPWVAYSLAVFGTVLPDTLSAKQAQMSSGYFGEGHVFVRMFFDLAAPFQYERWLLVVAPLAAVGLVRSLLDARVRPVALPLVLATTLHALAYGFVLDVPGYHWYYAWEVFTLAVLAGLAVGWGVELLVGVAPRVHVPRPAVAVAAAGAFAVVALVGATRTPIVTSSPKQYIDMGHWLRANTEPTDRIAATEIGAIGWYSDRPIVDYMGLLSTDSIAELGRGDLVSWLEREEPDYWIVHQPLWPFEHPATNQLWFTQAYQPVMETQPTAGREGLVVYKRVVPIAEARNQVENGGAAPT